MLRLFRCLMLVLPLFLFLASGARAGELENELIQAAEAGQMDAVRAAMKKGADVNGRDMFGLTALMRAVLRGHTEIVRDLLEKGAQVNEQNFVGTTALMHAAGSGNPDIVRALLDKGADVTLFNAVGFTALAIALAEEKVNEDIVRLLKAAGAKE